MLLTSLLGLLSTVSPLTEVGEELLLMRLGRLELPQCCHHRHLKPTRLPIPPQPRGCHLTATGQTYTTAPLRAPDRVLPATNASSRWYKGTDKLLSHVVLTGETPWYDWDSSCPLDSGSAI